MEEKKPKKPRKIKFGGRTYNRAETQVAIEFAPTIYPCKKCTWPVARGYCCRWCGDSAPYALPEEDADE